MKCNNELEDSKCCVAARMTRAPILLDEPYIFNTPVKCPYDGDTQKCLNEFIDFSMKNSDDEGSCDWRSYVMGLNHGSPIYRLVIEKGKDVPGRARASHEPQTKRRLHRTVRSNLF